MKEFADKVKEARLALGMSEEQLAEKIGVSTGTVRGYEKGRFKPHSVLKIRLARALKVSFKYLSDDECEDPLTDIDKDPC